MRAFIFWNMSKAVESEIENFLQEQTLETLAVESPYERLRMLVADLIDHDFNGLVNLLYRVDVPEAELKANLGKNAEDTAGIISQMLIRRQLQKLQARQMFAAKPPSNSAEERW